MVTTTTHKALETSTITRTSEGLPIPRRPLSRGVGLPVPFGTVKEVEVP